MMKKTALLLATTILLAAIFAPPAGAYQIPNTNIPYNINVYTAGINNDPQAQAEMFKKLGLFRGTDKGFELDRPMTRAEAAVMLVRFLGAEDKVLSGVWRHPFTDVPAWADKYIGWLYQSGLTKGVSAAEYGAQDPVSLKQYAMFLSRALLGPDINDDMWKYSGMATEEEVELWDETNGFFNRAAAVGLSVRAFINHYTANGNWMSMAQFLIDKGVFTADELGEASWDVLPSAYRTDEESGALTRYVADVPVERCGVPGLSLAGSSQYSAQKYLHAARITAGGVEFFILDPKTLAVLASDDYDATNGWQGFDYIGTVEGTDYLVETRLNAESGNTCAGALLSWDGQALSPLLDAQALWQDGRPPFAYEAISPPLAAASTLIDYKGYTRSFAAAGNLLLVGNEELFFITRSGISKSAYPAGVQVLDFDGRVAVCQLVEAAATAICCMDSATGRVLDEYTVPPDMEGDMGQRTIFRWEQGYFYGEAGLYKLIDGRLYQLTARPSLDLAFTQIGAATSDPIILTHAPGERVYGMNAPGGNMIVMIRQDGGEKVMLANDPPHGIEIAGIYGMDSAVWFYSEQGVGMQRANVYTYALTFNEKGTLIHVADYKAGRPETEDGWSEGNLTGYKKAYIENEQARLDALGLSCELSGGE